jgi:uncharacterized protein (DUF4415 family)
MASTFGASAKDPDGKASKPKHAPIKVGRPLKADPNLLELLDDPTTLPYYAVVVEIDGKLYVDFKETNKGFQEKINKVPEPKSVRPTQSRYIEYTKDSGTNLELQQALIHTYEGLDGNQKVIFHWRNITEANTNVNWTNPPIPVAALDDLLAETHGAWKRLGGVVEFEMKDDELKLLNRRELNINDKVAEIRATAGLPEYAEVFAS